jgi:AhpD family alkylhydroperoxidase
MALCYVGPYVRAFKRKIGLKDYYDSMVLAYRAALCRKRIDRKFAERLMLAVTEVNGCEACSYAHTLVALRKGFRREEIEAFLGASTAYVLPEEARGILFAQHYADSGGRPDREAYRALENAYGTEKSQGIVATVQLMQAANMIGLPLSALLSRLRGRPYPNSSLAYELGMPASSLLVLPLSLLHALLRCIGGKGNLRFADPRTKTFPS